MKLHPIGGRSFSFTCIRCGTRAQNTGSAAADLDGVPFRDYYCSACAANRRQERAAADIVQGPIVGRT